MQFPDIKLYLLKDYWYHIAPCIKIIIIDLDKTCLVGKQKK